MQGRYGYMDRAGFTLVELLVATALTLFIMVILTIAFTAALRAFHQLKGLGDMEERLRTASAILRRDLAADHFDGKRRLSDPGFWQTGPPREGYFRIQQNGEFSVVEGLDGDGISSYYSTRHVIAFTVKLRGNNRSDFFSTFIGDPASPLLSPSFGQPDSRYQDVPGTYNNPWAEVIYFLSPNGASAGGTPLFALYRRQLLAVPADNNQVQLNWGSAQVPTSNLPFYSGISCKPNHLNSAILYFNSPIDLTAPERRFYITPQPQYPPPLGDGSDLLLTDVVCFNVQVLSPDLLVSNDFTDVSSNDRNIPYFDTWSTLHDDFVDHSRDQAPLRIRINAVQIILRVWDLKTQQTRQITIVQDM